MSSRRGRRRAWTWSLLAVEQAADGWLLLGRSWQLGRQQPPEPVETLGDRHEHVLRDRVRVSGGGERPRGGGADAVDHGDELVDRFPVREPSGRHVTGT